MWEMPFAGDQLIPSANPLSQNFKLVLVGGADGEYRSHRQHPPRTVLVLTSQRQRL